VSGQGAGRPAVDPYVPHYGAAEMARRLAAVRALIARRDLDGIVVYGAGRFALDLYWLSDWPGGREGLAYVPAHGEPSLLVQFFNHVSQARRMAAFADVAWAGAGSTAALVARLPRTGRLRLGFAGPLPHRIAHELAAARDGLTWHDVGADVAALRAVKSQAELERIRRAARLTDRSLDALFEAMRPGARERDLVRALEDVYLADGGYTGIHFLSSMPMDDPTAFVPSQYPNDRPLAVGDVVIGEYTGCWWGGSSQIHRTFSLGREPDRGWRRLHDAAVAAYEAVVAVLRDGATAADVVAAADAIADGGFEVCDDLLHGVDQLPPVLRTRQSAHGPQPDDFVFRENMVVTVQPNVVLPGRAMGLQFGETVRIVQGGVERLHALAPEWRVRAVP
jgi:Xaa-Pro aminopeptidase